MSDTMAEAPRSSCSSGRRFFIDLARAGLRMPVGTDLVLHEHADAEQIMRDGARLGQVIVEAARRYRTPLALPLMDLTLEKEAMLTAIGVPLDDAATYHFAAAPDDALMASFDARLAGAKIPRLDAHVESVRYVATQTDLVPMGMAIGPFSLMTKLLSEPIVPVYRAAAGASAAQDASVACVERCLELATRTILYSVGRQIAAGAKAIFIAEPAANQFYISPRQLEKGSDIFRRYVVELNQRVRRPMAEAGVELMFHCCGEITAQMLAGFVELHPTVLSLGSSRRLWEDAALVPHDIVLFGNIPSKKFFMDSEITVERVRELASDLQARMRETGHPFILGTECDVLNVEGYEEPIRRKVQALLET